jgi:hypothetical protein
MRVKRNTYRILVGKPDGKRTLEKPKCGWVDNIKIQDDSKLLSGSP